jgi:hypothetical protein
LSVFQTNVYTSVLGSKFSPLLPADTTWVTLSVTLPGVQATAGAVGSSGTTPSPASSTRWSAFRVDSPHRRSRA